MKICIYALILVALFATGCAWVPQKVTIAPQLPTPVSKVGNGATVVVKVLDTRPSLLIGYRGLDSKLAEITTAQELAPIFQQKIIEGLAQQGFKAVSSSEQPARVLKVEIRTLQYTTDIDFWKGVVRTKAAIQAYSKTDNAIFDQLYVAERQETVAEAPRAKTNDRLINGVISDVLQRLLGDQKLARMLAN
jgi:uncharacterized lipoprotein YajG